MTEPESLDPAEPGAEPPHRDAGAPAGGPPAVPWRWTDALLVLVLTTLLVIVAAPLVYVVAPDAVSEPLLLLVAAAVTGAVTWLVAARRHGVDAARLLWGHRRPTGRDVLIGLAGAGVALVGVNVIVAVLTLGGQPPEVQTGLRDAARDRSLLPLVALAAVVIVPVAEELLYRGMLFQALRTRLGRWPAIGLSSLLFGLLHYQDTWSGTLLLLAAFYPLGMWLAWLFDRRGTLAVPIVTHMAYNGLNLLLLVIGRG